MSTPNTTQQLPLVLNFPCVTSIQVDDTLLSDLTWTSLADSFKRLKVHADCREGEKPEFCMSPTLRALAMLPVASITNREIVGRKWVPFLVDTGAPLTYFTKKTIEVLHLDTADHIQIGESQRVNFQPSTSHFDDINLLGTDFLSSCILTVDYPRKEVNIEETQRVRQRQVDIWVKQRTQSSSGEAISKVFSVTPEANHIEGLKKAIKNALESNMKGITVNAITMIILDSNNRECDKMTASLVENTEETPYSFVLS